MSVRYIVVSRDDHEAYDIPEAIGAGGMYEDWEAARRRFWELEKSGTPAKLYRLEEVNRTTAVGEDE